MAAMGSCTLSPLPHVTQVAGSNWAGPSAPVEEVGSENPDSWSSCAAITGAGISGHTVPAFWIRAT